MSPRGGATESRGRQRLPGSATTWSVLAALAICAAIPTFAGSGVVLLSGEAVILALFALSLNLLVGTTGLVSFGHAAFFGFGAFTVALGVTRLGWPPLATLALAPAVGAVASVVTGLVVFRGRELYFALLTLGVSQLYWAGAQGWTDLTGGENGIFGFFTPSWLSSVSEVYWFVLGVAAVCAGGLLIITRSPYGDALRGIRDNPRRATFIGLWVKEYEFVAFTIAGAFAAVAGGLFAMHQGQVSSDTMIWSTSTLPLIACLLGGIRYFIGPIIGAFLYVFLQDYIAAETLAWDIAIGAVVIVIAIGFPGGIVGAITATYHAMARRGGTGVDASTTRPDGTLKDSGGGGNSSIDGTAQADQTGLARTYALEARGLRKAFGGLVAVQDVSFTVERGSIHAIIGPNGAGKSTVFNLLTGVVRPDSGQVLLDGVDITDDASWRIVRRGLGRSFQQTTVFWSQSTLGNTVLARAAMRGRTRRFYGGHQGADVCDAMLLLDKMGLGPRASERVTELSHGDQRALEITVALATESRILLLDEPTAGLSPSETAQAIDLIAEIGRQNDLTVLFIEHDMEVVFRLADRITVLESGKVLADGSPQCVRNDPEVLRAYLGD